MESFQNISSVPCFEEIEIPDISPPSSLTENFPQNNDSATCFNSSSQETVSQPNLPLQQVQEMDAEILSTNGLYYIKWVCFQSHVSRAMYENQRKNVVGTGGMVTVACKGKAASSAASSCAVQSQPCWTIFEIEKSVATTASLLLQEAVKTTLNDQPIYLENVSPSIMKRILHYIKHGSVYGSMDNLEEFLEAVHTLKIGAVWPHHYAFLCITCASDDSVVTSKFIHMPWSNVILVEGSVDGELPVENKDISDTIASDPSDEFSVSKIINFSFDSSYSNRWIPPGQLISEPVSGNDKVTPSTSKSVSNVPTNYTPQQPQTAESSTVTNPSTGEKSTNLFSSAAASASGSTSCPSSESKSAALTPSASSTEPPRIKRKYTKAPKATPPLSHQILPNGTQCFFEPLPKFGIPHAMPPPPPPTPRQPLPHFIPQHHVPFPTSFRQADAAQLVAPKYPQNYNQGYFGQAPMPTTYPGYYYPPPQPYTSFPTSYPQAGHTQTTPPNWPRIFPGYPTGQTPAPASYAPYYHRPQQHNWAGAQCGTNVSTEADANAFHKKLEQTETQLLVCKWCNLKFDTAIALHLHRLRIHKKKNPLATSPGGSEVAGNQENLAMQQNQQQNQLQN